MSHILAKLKNAKLEDVKNMLTEHAPIHAQQGLYMEYVWMNSDDETEVQFLFRADDLEAAKVLIKKTHAEARAEDPDVNLPEMTFLIS